MKKLDVLLMVLAVTLGAFAQDVDQGSGESSFGVVIYADGNVVSVIRDLRRTEYDAFTGELLGFAVYPGDIIQTDPDTYVEIQLLPSRSVVKVAENTSFTIEQISATGDGVFDLAYGRLRARVNRLAGESPFEIRGVGATAGVRGTDFGTDVIVRPAGGESLTLIYCFEGEVQVVVADQPSGTEPIVVTANQMITATTLSPTAAAAAAGGTSVPSIEVEPLLPAISEFWQREDFVVEPEDAELVLAEFPHLRADATDRLGDVPFLRTDGAPVSLPVPGAPVSTQPSPSDAAAVETTPVGDELRAADAVAIEGDDVAADPERYTRLIGVTRVTGLTLTGLGVLADAAAVTFFFWGDQILPGWPPASDPDILIAVAATGGVFLISGILSLLFSVQLSR
ncbi:MAG: FecR family protein [Spirochaetia bacterium]